jgi:hypothetical protein
VARRPRRGGRRSAQYEFPYDQYGSYLYGLMYRPLYGDSYGEMYGDVYGDMYLGRPRKPAKPKPRLKPKPKKKKRKTTPRNL